MRLRKIIAIAFVFALAVVSFSWLANRGASYRQKLQGLAPTDVTRITLSVEPLTLGANGERELFSAEREEFLGLLAGAVLTSPNHPRGGWTCFSTIQTKAEAFTFRIQATSNNGTIVLLFSNGLDGWSCGTLRNDALKPFIERVLFNKLGASDEAKDRTGLDAPQ